MIASQTMEQPNINFKPGDLIRCVKVACSWWSPYIKHNKATGEPRRWAAVDEIKLVLSVLPVNGRGNDMPTTCWTLTCLSEHGIEYFRARKLTWFINFELLATNLSDKPVSST